MVDEPEYNRRLRLVIRVQRFISGALYVSGEVLQALVDEDFSLADYILTGAHVKYIERLRERIQYARKSTTPYPPPRYPTDDVDRRKGTDRRVSDERREAPDRRMGRDRRASSVQLDATGADAKPPTSPPPPLPSEDGRGTSFVDIGLPTPAGTMKRVFSKMQEAAKRRSSQRIVRPESDGLGAGKKTERFVSPRIEHDTDKNLPMGMDTVYSATYTGKERRSLAPEDKTGPFTTAGEDRRKKRE